MLSYLKNKKFIGDLSLQDADVLVKHAEKSKSVLEFGAGGSTQLLAQCGCIDITSVETDAKWIEATKQRLTQIATESTINFIPYTEQFNQEFDLIFVDGVDNLRRQFAIGTWKYLKIGGIMLFHDTRRFQDFQNVAWVSQLYHNEISCIMVNESASDGATSNITAIHKKLHEPYVNWNYSEDKPLWSYAALPNTESFPLWQYK